MYCHLTITPISRNINSAGYIDYKEQLERVKNNESIWCWDDSRYNKAKKGELFAFYFHEIRVVIHEITDVKPPSARLPSWSKNIGQGDRNVLELSAPLKEISWTEWQLVNGPLSKMGTYTTNDLSTERPLLYKLLQSIRTNKSSKPKLIIEDELSEEEYDEIDISEEESRLLERLKELEKLKQLKTLKDKRKEYIEKIKELTNEVLNIDKMISEFQEKSVYI
jgi:hypothetical protein